MWISDTSIRQPVFITMVMAAILVLGGISYSRLAVDLFPDISFPVVAVTVSYPGATPEEVETQVTKPLEEALGSLNGLENIRSTAAESRATIVLEFKLEHPLDRAATDVRDRVSASRGLLPTDALDPVIQRFDPGAQPILTIAAAPKAGTLSPYEVRKLVEDQVKPVLERIDGVAAVGLQGGSQREVQVSLNLDAVRARNLSVPQIVAALRNDNLNVPGGRVTDGSSDLQIRTTGQFKTLDDISQVVIGTGRNGALIYLRDIAAIQDGIKEVQGYTRLDGKDAVALTVSKQSGSNTVEVAAKVKAQLKRLEQQVGDLALTPVRDESKQVEDSLHDVILALLLGAVAATLVVFVFFGDVRSTSVTVAGLPVVVFGTFAVMSLLHFSLNLISMMALSLSIGLLIDDAIVVRENIFRHIEQGMEPRRAASFGTAEIALAVLATTFSLVAVFLPVGFTTGIIGQFFRQFGITVAAAVLISLFEAFTLAPMLSAYFSRRQTPSHALGEDAKLSSFQRFYQGMLGGYRSLLAWGLRHRGVVVVVAMGVTIGSMALLPLIGTTFLPQQDQGNFSLAADLPPGATLEETNVLARYLEGVVQDQPEVRFVYATVGGAGAPEQLSLFVQSNGRKSRPLMERLRALLANVPSVQFSQQQGAGGNAAPIQVSVIGDLSLADLDVLSQQVLAKMRGVPNVIQADRSLKDGKPELRLAVDRQRSSDLGVSAGSVGSTVRTLTTGDVATVLREGDDETDIRVRLRPEDRKQVQTLLALTIPTNKGTAVPLSAVVRMEAGSGPTQIQHYNREREIVVSADYLGRSLGEIIADVTSAIKELSLPPQVAVKFQGHAQQSADAFASFGLALGMAVIFLYMVLGAQFGSFLHPFTIMLSLPMSFGGAFLGLLLAGKALDIMGLIGIIMLMGLVTKNAILLIDYILRLRRDGYSREDAVLAAGPVRLRPILMTTIAMIFGMLPTALALGAGSEFRSPMAITVIGGLITSTLLTLVVVPVFYTLLDDAQQWRPWRRRPEPDRLAEPVFPPPYAKEELVGAGRDG